MDQEWQQQVHIDFISGLGTQTLSTTIPKSMKLSDSSPTGDQYSITA
ncbi:MAG: hypothetical protein R3A45_11770 [Bdellovibrionota bacterium]